MMDKLVKDFQLDLWGSYAPLVLLVGGLRASKSPHWVGDWSTWLSSVLNIGETRRGGQLSLVMFPRRIGIQLNLADAFNPFQDVSALADAFNTFQDVSAFNWTLPTLSTVSKTHRHSTELCRRFQHIPRRIGIQLSLADAFDTFQCVSAFNWFGIAHNEHSFPFCYWRRTSKRWAVSLRVIAWGFLTSGSVNQGWDSGAKSK